MGLLLSRWREDIPYKDYIPHISDLTGIIEEFRKKRVLQRNIAEIYEVPVLLVLLTIWAALYAALIFRASNGYEIPKSLNLPFSYGNESQLASSQVSVTGANASKVICTSTLNGTVCFEDRIEWEEHRVDESSRCCIFNLPVSITIWCMVINFCISTVVWDARHMKQGLEAGNFLSLMFFIFMHGYLDPVSDTQPDWTYTFVPLLHFFTLSASFSTVIVLNDQLSMCFKKKQREAGDKGGVPYGYFCYFKLSVMVNVFYEISLRFLSNSFLYPRWYLHWCVDSCWLTNRWIFFAFYAPVLSLHVCIALSIFVNMVMNMACEIEKEEPLNSLIIGFIEHFHGYSVLYLTWLFGACVNYLNSSLLWEAYSFIIVLETFWYISKPLENGFYNVFVTPFVEIQERFWERMEQHKEDMSFYNFIFFLKEIFWEYMELNEEDMPMPTNKQKEQAFETDIN